MTGKTLDIDNVISDRHNIAIEISNRFIEWQNRRAEWLEEKRELRNYLFATDTRSTENAALPWKNSTTTPKLTQIRDNLHANYMDALFPNDKWLNWEGDDLDSEDAVKKNAIENYMRTKLHQSKATVEVSKLALDYIDDGNVFATAEWCDETITTLEGETIPGYVGPKVVRISPLDIVFNPLAPSFERSPKILRTIKSIGELRKERSKLPDGSNEAADLDEILNRADQNRHMVGQIDRADTIKDNGYIVDGFGSYRQYFESGYVEILTFYGDMYDMDSGEFYENHVIKIIDRMHLVTKRPIESGMAGDGFFHVGWRQRPDNLYSMGPLDNLVGMQYRIDHLENLKADIIDMFAFPMVNVIGTVEDFEWGPGQRIYSGEDGRVDILRPDAGALQLDTQIQEYERRMEELAGAPREAMGIRSPGEKTKFEVQKLDNASSRIFNHKIQHFETTFLEPLINYMLILARKNMSDADTVRTVDSEVEAVVFSQVSREDLVAVGRLRPVGAQHYAQKANALQNVIGLLNSAVGQDPSVNVHLSGKKIAKLVERLSDLDEYEIFSENIRVIEQAETQKMINAEQDRVNIEDQTPDGLGVPDVEELQQGRAVSEG